MDRKNEAKIREFMRVLRPIQRRLIKKYGIKIMKPRVVQSADFADEMDKAFGQ